MPSALYPNTYVFRAFAQGATVPLAGGYLYFYAAGTSTPQAAYTDTTGTVPCANPLQLDANGVASFCLLVGQSYKISLTDANGVTQDGWPKDNISTVLDASLITYLAPYTGAVARTQADQNLDSVNVLDFMTSVQKSDVRAYTFAQDISTPLANALAALPASGGVIRMPGGGYFGTLSIRRNNITILGDGSASTILKASTLSPGGVLELGDTASGNGAAAYNNVNVYGLTVDGNNGVIATPSDDVHGHGIISTKVSYKTMRDVVVQNCHVTGIAVCINSNYDNIQARVKNCGSAVVNSVHYPNFDINSSEYSFYDVISEGGYYGARMLDNCYGNHLRCTVYNASIQGVVLNNQPTNESHGNKVDANVIGGCSSAGVNVSINWKTGIVNATVSDVTGLGFLDSGTNQGIAAANVPTGNVYNVVTRNCNGAGTYIGSAYNIWNIQSYLDGRAGAQGSAYAIDVNGNNNEIKAIVQDSSTWQVRGLTFRAGSSNNRLLSYDWTNTTDPLQLLGTGNIVTHTEGKGADIVAAATLVVPFNGSLFSITGNTGISAISPTAVNAGRVITLRFTGTPTVTNGASLKLAGAANFSATADDCITLMSDGSIWTEVSRSVN